MRRATPSFVTLTGCDRSDAIEELRDLAQEYGGRVELGILISTESAGTPRFPSDAVLTDLRRSGLRLSAHLCGEIAHHVLAGAEPRVELAGFSRAQVNLVGRHAEPREIEHAICFGMARGIRIILQCEESYPSETRCDWLLDSSFGQGRAVGPVPDMGRTPAFCGVSGGLSVATVQAVLSRIPDSRQPFWIDTESALFEGSTFSTSACRAFLSSVYDRVPAN